MLGYPSLFYSHRPHVLSLIEYRFFSSVEISTLTPSKQFFSLPSPPLTTIDAGISDHFILVRLIFNSPSFGVSSFLSQLDCSTIASSRQCTSSQSNDAGVVKPLLLSLSSFVLLSMEDCFVTLTTSSELSSPSKSSSTRKPRLLMLLRLICNSSSLLSFSSSPSSSPRLDLLFPANPQYNGHLQFIFGVLFSVLSESDLSRLPLELRIGLKFVLSSLLRFALLLWLLLLSTLSL
mmetsp:Transcript_8526/g.12768  ORF Transcript_8526/g.12768 Transcript_8526/m.12768 type:complete len:234 (-) Transcript_8526:108-809(-)